MEGKKMNNSQNKNLLTEGSIWKKLMGFAFPLFLGNLFQQLYLSLIHILSRWKYRGIYFCVLWGAYF